MRICNGSATEKWSEGLKIDALQSADCPNIRHVTTVMGGRLASLLLSNADWRRRCIAHFWRALRS